jgi:hypothetical protein
MTSLALFPRLLSSGFKDIIQEPYQEEELKQMAVKISSQLERITPWIAPSRLTTLDVKDD